ncbi:hypothetical protein HIM_11681 [Hirsutella minnesotensis 3608]|uniref:Uncharacterized protein n=1 Tax=Hirsutella minnesotensis 3608 TaxID=1043627 RepID=A0A0F7ZWG4_9HYPO|nr:hypothetical protein HIM_11681 [Hirsutella minnesotensis 3608]
MQENKQADDHTAGTSSAGTTTTTTEHMSAGVAIKMPEGCRCGLEWRIPDDSEGYTWNYQTVCPVAAKDHPYWRPFFRHIIASGSGGGQAPGGARIIINDGKWRHAPKAR